MNFIISEIKENILFLTLNRPEKFNSFCQEMAFELQHQLDFASKNDDIRCIYLTGTGKAFCAGQDLAEALDDNGIELHEIVEKHYNPIILKLRELEKPIICAVNGVAAGAGANIALACDIVVANENASFIQAFSKIGLIPDSGGTFFLPKLIGFQKATALMILGEKISATDAEKMGMIFKVFSDEQFIEESKNIASQLAKMPTKALGLTKKLLNESYQNNLSQQLELEKEMQTQAGNTSDYKEGVEAFLEKRLPNFRGK